MANKLLTYEELESLVDRLRVSMEMSIELPPDSPEFERARKLPQLPKISGDQKVAIFIPKNQEQ